MTTRMSVVFICPLIHGLIIPAIFIPQPIHFIGCLICKIITQQIFYFLKLFVRNFC
jgi:hypothetical protein